MELRNYGLLAEVVIALLTCGSSGEVGAAQITNGSFETGNFTGWQTLGTAGVETSNFGITPSSGTFQALLENHPSGFFGVPVDEIESFLGLGSGSLGGLGNGGVIQGAVIKQTFAANAGDVLSFNWNFLTNENTPDPDLNDFAFVSISPGTLSELADTSSSFIPAVPTFVSMTGYRTFAYTFPLSGTFTLGFGVADVGDEFTTSSVLIDNVSIISVSAVPEPSSLILLFNGVLSLTGYTWLHRKRAGRET